jgi:hypothetical protein
MEPGTFSISLAVKDIGVSRARDLQKTLLHDGGVRDQRACDVPVGPAFIMLTDPGGNQILSDQHV